MVSTESVGAICNELFGLCDGFVKAADCSIGIKKITAYLECIQVFGTVAIDAPL